MEEETYKHEKGKFFGCYLLCSTNPKFKGRTYIGFTVNPNRRIQQHNAGYAKGGAKRTSGKGPWDMVLIVHGFPNEISALRFEWAWQNPEKSLRLKHLVPKTKQYGFQFKLNILSEMLRIGPWHRLALTIRWLKQEYRQDFPLNKLPPNHMPIVYGLVELVDKKNKPSKSASSQPNQQSTPPPPHRSQNERKICFLCKKEILRSDTNSIENNKIKIFLKCLNCDVINHTICLAKHFLKSETNDSSTPNRQLLPIDGNCPRCDAYEVWGELMKQKYELPGTSQIDLNKSDTSNDQDEDDLEEIDDDDDEDIEDDDDDGTNKQEDLLEIYEDNE